jgi:hypothetical protein
VTALATFAVAAAFLTGFVRLGNAVTEQARAQAIADGIALAAADQGADVARHIAKANGVSDVVLVAIDSDVVVKVSREGLVARARASTAP